jgi:hypothetical protein
LLTDVNLSLQLNALSIFASAPAGIKYLQEYIEVGGLITTLEILNLTSIKDVPLHLTRVTILGVQTIRIKASYAC